MRLLYLVVRTLNILAVLAVVVIGIGAWMLGSERGSAALVGFAERRVVPGLSVEGIRGTLLGGLSVDRLRLVRDGRSLDASGVAVSFDALSLLTAAIVVERATVREARFEGPVDPAAFDFPVAVVVQRGHVSRFRVAAGARDRLYADVDFTLRLVDGRLEVERVERAGFGATRSAFACPVRLTQDACEPMAFPVVA